MISPETISLVRDRIDMAAVVLESVPSLKRRGRSWVGLCPFHKEKSPSFHVNAERGFYKCFGCGEAGDVFTFAMKEYGYTFAEAVRAMAERVGIEIQEDVRERTDVDRARKQKDDVLAANQLAATWFAEQLRKHPLRDLALGELARRGVVPGEGAVIDEALQSFRIGYAPAEWDGLATFLRQQGISPTIGELAGLIAPRSSSSGHYDRFRHRLMFSVLDTQGRVVAFSGRSLPDPPGAKPPDEKPAKYINSKETPVYTKGNVLFGLFQARQAIRIAETAILVEGNFDVFSLHARGMANVVGPLGTAFTPEQAALLKRYCPRVVLLFDGDAAGRKAVRTAREACTRADLVAKVAVLPDGMDPDDFVRTRGPAALDELVKSAIGLLEFLVESELDAAFVAADVREKLARVDRVVELIAGESDPLVRMTLKSHADNIAGRLDLHGPDAFRALEQRIRASIRRTPVRTSDRPPPGPGGGSGGSNASAHAGHATGGQWNGSSASSPRAPEKSHDPRYPSYEREPVVDRNAVRSAHGGSGGSGPPSGASDYVRDARSPKTAGSAERRAIVAALLDYPSLLSDADVQRACALLEGPAALTVAALARSWVPRPVRSAEVDTPGIALRETGLQTAPENVGEGPWQGEKALDTSGFLAQIPPAIQTFASERLAAPLHESEREAKEALLANAEKLERLLRAEDVGRISRELTRSIDSAEAFEKLGEAQERAAGRHKDIKARAPVRAAGSREAGSFADTTSLEATRGARDMSAQSTGPSGDTTRNSDETRNTGETRKTGKTGMGATADEERPQAAEDARDDERDHDAEREGIEGEGDY